MQQLLIIFIVLLCVLLLISVFGGCVCKTTETMLMSIPSSHSTVTVESNNTLHKFVVQEAPVPTQTHVPSPPQEVEGHESSVSKAFGSADSLFAWTK